MWADLVDFTEATFAQQVHEQVATVQDIMRLETAPLLVPHPLETPASKADRSFAYTPSNRKGRFAWQRRLLNIAGQAHFCLVYVAAEPCQAEYKDYLHSGTGSHKGSEDSISCAQLPINSL